MVRRESGFLRAAAQSATEAMEAPQSQIPAASDGPVAQVSEVVAADGVTGESASGDRHVDEHRRAEQRDGGEIKSIYSGEQHQTPRTSNELAKLLTDPAGYVREQSQRRVGGRLRTVDGRISADVAATFAAHCDADLGKISQADLVEVLIRAYLSDVGIGIRRPFT